MSYVVYFPASKKSVLDRSVRWWFVVGFVVYAAGDLIAAAIDGWK